MTGKHFVIIGKTSFYDLVQKVAVTHNATHDIVHIGSLREAVRKRGFWEADRIDMAFLLLEDVSQATSFFKKYRAERIPVVLFMDRYDVAVVDEVFRTGYLDIMGVYILDEIEAHREDLDCLIEEEQKRAITRDSLDDICSIGWRVEAGVSTYQKRKFVSLYIGSMREFMRDLRLMIEMIQIPAMQDIQIPFSLKNEGRWTERTLQEKRDRSRTDAPRHVVDQLDCAVGSLFSLKSTFKLGHILIEGETGTGKTLIADWIHQHVSPPVVAFARAVRSRCGPTSIILWRPVRLLPWLRRSPE